MSTAKPDMFDKNMSSFETPQTVRQWCTKLGLNPRKVATVGPMVPRVTEEFIYQVLFTKMRNRLFTSQEWLRHERPREIDRDRVPPDIDAESEGPWKIVLPDMSDDADELTTQGEALTTKYAVKAPERVPLNKTLFDSPAEKSQIKRCPSCESMVSKGSRHSSGGRLDTPEIVSALEQLTDQLAQLAWNGDFKRLKVFSGTDPVPTGEESFESWRDSTVVSVRYWTGPETTMRRKILESLSIPAVDVVKSYIIGHPDATSGDLIEVLEVTFGPVESATEMLYRFVSTFQKDKEDLSVYLVRLEQGLRLLVSRSAITDDKMDSLRIRQLKRGTLNNDPVAMTIRAHYKDKLPPGYVALMERVRHGRFYGRCYKCQVMGHQARSCKTYKHFTVQKSYYEPSICESDSPEEEKVLSPEKTTVENPVGMKVVPETSHTPDRSKGPDLGKCRSSGWANVRVSGNSSDTNIIDCFTVQACQGVRQARTLPVCPRGECRGHEESFPCLSACDIIQPSCMLDSDPIGWEPQCILGRKGVPDFGAKSTGSPRERAERASVSSC
ncbi:hypothetical protein XELAEV_18016243mg [Xenopus laevis]|uniref:CCHC-type domain-containing protein n=1 Tax=Xenopus laevis TaxID=8355 RepID=A0A974DJW7_XENLA|nr:hypothetical protein XELAEV_18016243mg [Xenopus laevis]